MQAAALRIGNLLNQSELGRDIKLPAMTVHRYLNLLETSYQIVRLEPYAVNRTKRLIKTPKLYWNDPALALHLAHGGADGEPGGAATPVKPANPACQSHLRPSDTAQGANHGPCRQRA